MKALSYRGGFVTQVQVQWNIDDLAAFYMLQTWACMSWSSQGFELFAFPPTKKLCREFQQPGHFSPNYAGLCARCMLQEALPLEGRVAGDAWPIFNSSKCICSAQKLHQLCLLPLFLPILPLPSDALAPCGHSLGASRSQSSDHFRCSSARLPLTSGGFPVPSLLSILSFPVSLPRLFYVCVGGWR